MLSKIKSSNYGKLKLLLGLIVIFGLVTAFSLEEKKDKKPKEKNLILSLDDQVFRNTEDLNFVTGVMNSKLSVEEKKAKLQERYKLDYRYGVYGVSWKTDPEKAIYFFDGKEIPYEEQKRLQENKMISMSTSITPNREEYEVFYEKYGERVKNGIYILLPESDRDIFFPKEAISQTKPTIESVIEKFTKNRYSEIKLRKNRINIDANGKKFIITGEDVSTNDVINILKGGKYEITITGEKSLKLTQLSNTPLEATTIVKPTLEKGKQVFFIVEEMPEFPGGESALRKFIAETVKYPVEAQKNKIQGKVYVTFVVDSEGNVTDSKIARGVDPSLDMEALRVVGLLPKWKPGLQKGKPVAVSYTVPINFVLN
jgi:TonB family protein